MGVEGAVVALVFYLSVVGVMPLHPCTCMG